MIYSRTAGRLVLAAALLAGCGRLGSVHSVMDPAASPSSAGELAGTWQGTFYQVGASLTLVEGRITLDVHDDGTFTSTTTRKGSATPIEDSGMVVTTAHHRIILKGAAESLPLRRRGDTLYGVSDDVISGQMVQIDLDRAR